MGTRNLLPVLFLAATSVLAPPRIEAQNENAFLMRAELAPLDSGAAPTLARDAAPGAGIFEWQAGPQVFGWPVVARGQTAYHFAFLDRNEHLCYAQVSDSLEWSAPVRIDTPAPSPGYPTHNLTASKLSGRVAVTWVCEDTPGVKPAYYRISTDGGSSWAEPVQLDPPLAYGSDTLTSFHLSSLYPFWDRHDSLHIVAAVYPIVHDTGYVTPAQIWHWSRWWSDDWSLVSRAGCKPQDLQASVGYNALYACRPSIGEQRDGVLVAAWEQFDSASVEPGPPARLRAGIFLARSMDNGSTWGPSRRILSGEWSSLRFPCISGQSYCDSMSVLAEDDQVAGFSALGEGPTTQNAIIAARVWPGWYPAVNVDTVGGTTFDLQTVGPAVSRIVVDPTYGCHVAWPYSAEMQMPHWDLNMRYNFFDNAAGAWNFIDPANFMNSGVNSFPERTGYGNMDFDPVTGVAIISGALHPPVGIKDSRPAGQQRTADRLCATLCRGSVVLEGTGPAVLLDITGRKVAELVPGQNPVDHLNQGVYFICQRPARGSETRKLVLTR